MSSVLLLVGLSIHQSRPVWRQCYSLQDYRYTSRDQCDISATFCRTIDTLVETSVTLLLLSVGPSIHQSSTVCHQSYFFVGISIHQSRPVWHQCYFWQDYSYTSPDQCVVSPTFCRTINTLVKTSAALVLLLVGPSTRQSSSVCRQSYVLQEYRYNNQHQYILGPTFCRTIDTLAESSVSLVLHLVRLSIHQSRAVCRQSYFLQECRYNSQDQCIVNVSLATLFVGISIHQSKSTFRQSYLFVRLSIQQSIAVYRQSQPLYYITLYYGLTPYIYIYIYICIYYRL